MAGSTNSSVSSLSDKSLMIISLAATILVFLLFVLSLISVVSLPLGHDLDLMHIDFTGLRVMNNTSAAVIEELRIGIWGYCFTNAATDTSSCVKEAPGHFLNLTNTMGSDVTIVGPTLSRSLLLHPIQIAFYFAILVLFIVLGFFRIENAAKFVLVCSIVSVVFCLTTFVVDAVFYAIVLRRVHSLGFVSHVKMGAAFVVTIVQVIIALAVAITVWWIDNGRKLFRRNRKARVVREKVVESRTRTFSEPEQAHVSIITT